MQPALYSLPLKISVKGYPKIIPTFFNALKSISEQVAEETIVFDAVIFEVTVGLLCVITTNVKPALV